MVWFTFPDGLETKKASRNRKDHWAPSLSPPTPWFQYRQCSLNLV